MALTYAQLDALTTTDAFLGRVRTAVAGHAHYWESNPGATDAQKQWCDQVFINGRCPQIAADMARELVQDGKFTSATAADASDVTDADLQSAVDAICEKYV